MWRSLIDDGRAKPNDRLASLGGMIVMDGGMDVKPEEETAKPESCQSSGSHPETWSDRLNDSTEGAVTT